MKIKDLMSRDVEIARPDDSLQHVAGRMAAGDFGFMPVVEEDRVIGTITDRDLTVRALAKGAGADDKVSQYLSRDAITALDTDDLKTALDLMSRARIRRLPVTDKHGRLVGVISLGDLSVKVKERYAGEALESISQR